MNGPYEIKTPQGEVLERSGLLHAAAEIAGKIANGDLLIDGKWIKLVLLTGPEIQERAYHWRWRDGTYRYRHRCPGRSGEACQNPNGPWMHPTSKESRSCDFCWSKALSPTTSQVGSKERLSARNKRMNKLLPPRAKI